MRSLARFERPNEDEVTETIDEQIDRIYPLVIEKLQARIHGTVEVAFLRHLHPNVRKEMKLFWVREKMAALKNNRGNRNLGDVRMSDSEMQDSIELYFDHRLQNRSVSS